MEKKEIPQGVFIGAIVVVVLVVAAIIYRQASVNPPTPRPNPQLFGGGKTANPAP